jgi:membrane carboxypeptidase/penicillin-binding protein
VFRPILSLFGTVFSLITLVVVIVGLSIGAVLHIYGKDLPSHESLANYTPPTISRARPNRLGGPFPVQRRPRNFSLEIRWSSAPECIGNTSR